MASLAKHYQCESQKSITKFESARIMINDFKTPMCYGGSLSQNALVDAVAAALACGDEAVPESLLRPNAQMSLPNGD